MLKQRADIGYDTLFDKTHAYLIHSDSKKLIAIGERKGNLYKLHCESGKRVEKVVASIKATDKAKLDPNIDLWHARFGHVNERRRLREHLNQYDIAFSRKRKYKRHDLFCCPACQLGKSRQKPFKKRRSVSASALLERVALDLTGPMSVPGTDGELYILVILDQKSHFNEVFCIRGKDEALDRFKKFKIKAEKQRDLRERFY